jgi:death-on-curing protein
VTVYLAVTQVLRLHEKLIAAFGGAKGLRDAGALESAVARPQQTFAGEDLYPDTAAKAAALMHSLVMNHPFIDGNKRVGAMAMELFLIANRFELAAADQEIETVTLAVARGELEAEALAIWLRQRTRRAEEDAP